MTTLGIDYGDAKVGIALAEGPLASPLAVIRYKNYEELIAKIKKVLEDEGVEEIVVGVSEGESAEKSREFGIRLSEALSVPVNFVDETLSSQDAQKLSVEAGMKRKKRRGMEDAFAATLILQSYLDSR